MRYEKRVTFVKSEENVYDPVEGRNKPVTVVSAPYPCNLSDLGIDRANALFGEFKRDVKVVRLQRGLDYLPIAVLLNGERFDIESHRLDNSVFYIVGDMK